MEIGVAEARRRFREILDRVEAGETVQIARRGEVVATVAPPTVPGQRQGEPFREALDHWRSTWDVDGWPDDDPFAGVRDRSPGRAAPW